MMRWLNGTSGVILRAAAGTFKDRQVEEHYGEIIKRGGLVGFYHFIYGNLGMKEQLEAFRQAIAGKQWPLGVWADVEMTAYSKISRQQLDEYLALAKDRVDAKIGIYTSRYMWDTMIKAGVEGEYKLWVANYDAKTPALPKTGRWKDWWLWQYTDRGRISGVDANLDLSWFNGSEAEFKAWTGSEGEVDSVSLKFERLERAITRLCAIVGADADEVMPG